MEAKPVKIYSPENAPRLQFVADLILNEILGLSWEIVTDRRKLGKYPVINYSDRNLPGSFTINPVKILFETGVARQDIRVDYWRNLPVFFRSSDNADLPFDIFAATFFLVTRYEEYFEFEPDQYGRFRSEHSIAARHGFIGIPVIDLWAKELARSLVRKFQNLTFRRNEYKALLTFDVDEPYAYLGKNLIGNIGGFLHDIRSKSNKVSHRLDCLRGGEKDPFEVFDYMIESIEQNKTETRFFFPVGNRSEFDNNPSWKNEKYRKLINGVADKFITGLHPSFNASESLTLIKTEIQRIKAIVKKDCRISRFHFLRISMPVSFRNLNSVGIREDYSMGYPDECGFRAGISRPFWFYDLFEDTITDLRIFPFQIMDVSLREYKKLNAVKAKELIRNIINQTKTAGGLFISIWHNTSLLETPECHDWREVFEFMLREQMA